jgi:hypothetical protein
MFALRLSALLFIVAAYLFPAMTQAANPDDKSVNNEMDDLLVESRGLRRRGRCWNDSHCRGDKYCNGGRCRNAGTCDDLADCWNPSNIYASILCVGPISCGDEGTCGRTCSASTCADGSEPVQCLVDPCEVTSPECLAEKPVSCVSDYCGGCNAYRFDKAGNQVCLPAV